MKHPSFSELNDLLLAYGLQPSETSYGVIFSLSDGTQLTFAYENDGSFSLSFHALGMVRYFFRVNVDELFQLIVGAIPNPTDSPSALQLFRRIQELDEGYDHTRLQDIPNPLRTLKNNGVKDLLE